MENMLQQKDSVVSPSYLNLLAKSFHENLSRETFNPLSPSPIKKKMIDELFECVWSFCVVGAKRVKIKRVYDVYKILDAEDLG